MAKKKVVKKTKSKSSVSGRKRGITALYATDQDMIIIIGGGLIVMMLTFAMFFLI